MINSIDTIAFGDSVALGVAQAAGIPYNAKIGRQPHEVAGAIEGTNDRLVYDRTVILSSGLSNNPDGRAYVEEQIALLIKMGAGTIVILGVGPGVRAGTNEWLADLPGKFEAGRALFAGPLTNTRDGVHPWSYDQLVDQIEAAIGDNP